MDATQIKVQEAPQDLKEKKRFQFQVPKKGKKWFKRLAVLAIAALALYWFVLRTVLGSGTGTEAGQYLSASAQLQDLTVSVAGTGTLAPIESYNVNALVSGEVLTAPFEVGDHIEKGDLLYQIDPGSAETALQQAELSVRQAQMSYDELAAGLRPCAPAAGVVQEVYVQKGDLVSPGTAIAAIADTSTMTLTLPFLSGDAAKLSVGQSVEVTVAGTLETLTGTVESVASADLVGRGGALVRQVMIRVNNPGALTTANTATAAAGDIACAGSGSFQEAMRQTVVAQTSGEVTDVLVTAGSQVSAGSALAVLGGSTAQNALENAAIALESAQLSIRQAQEALDNYTITAPISGTVIEKNLKAGDKVNSMDSGTLAVLYDMSSMELKMDVSELDIGKVREGQQVEITAKALPGETFTGRVERVSVNGATTNGFTNYPVTVVIEEYGDLKPGTNVTAAIRCETVKDALCVPVGAVNRGDTVLVPGEGALGEDGTTVVDPSKLESRPVTLGLSDDTYIQITSGLEEGETVLIPASPDSDPSGTVTGG